jgi:hypothetical protein
MAKGVRPLGRVLRLKRAGPRDRFAPSPELPTGGGPNRRCPIAEGAHPWRRFLRRCRIRTRESLRQRIPSRPFRTMPSCACLALQYKHFRPVTFPREPGPRVCHLTPRSDIDRTWLSRNDSRTDLPSGNRLEPSPVKSSNSHLLVMTTSAPEPPIFDDASIDADRRWTHGFAVCQAIPVCFSSWTNSKYSMTSRCHRLE